MVNALLACASSPGVRRGDDELNKPSRRMANACFDLLRYEGEAVRQNSRAPGQVLVEAGYLTLCQQAESLGLGRSTAWETLRGNHKHSGLSAAIIKRMLTSQQLPPPARKILLEYVEQKLAGAYGHNQMQLRKFRERLGATVWADGKDAARRRVVLSVAATLTSGLECSWLDRPPHGRAMQRALPPRRGRRSPIGGKADIPIEGA